MIRRQARSEMIVVMEASAVGRQVDQVPADFDVLALEVEADMLQESADAHAHSLLARTAETAHTAGPTSQGTGMP